MLTKFEISNIYTNQHTNRTRKNRKINSRRNRTQKRDYHHQKSTINTNNKSEIEWANYNYKTFLRTRHFKQFDLENGALGSRRVDLALGIVTKNVLDTLEVTSESKQQEIFERVKEVFFDGHLPLKFNNSNNKGWVTPSSIEESIHYMVNKLQIEECTKKYIDDKPINQEEKLEVFQKTFSKNLLALLPDMLVGQKGDLRHGFIDKSVQAKVINICALCVMLDNISNGWENNTQKEVEDRAEGSFRYILMAMLIAGMIYLAEKKIENREEDLKRLKNDSAKTKQNLNDIRAVIYNTKTVVNEIIAQKNYYVFTRPIDKAEAEQIVFETCDEKTRDEVLKRINQVFERAGATKITLSTLKENIYSILSQDITEHDKLEVQYHDIRQKHKALRNITKSERDLANIIVAINDFLTGYPKHLINTCTDECVGFRFFDQKSTRDRVLLRNDKESSELDKTDHSLKIPCR